MFIKKPTVLVAPSRPPGFPPPTREFSIRKYRDELIEMLQRHELEVLGLKAAIKAIEETIEAESSTETRNSKS